MLSKIPKSRTLKSKNLRSNEPNWIYLVLVVAGILIVQFYDSSAWKTKTTSNLKILESQNLKDQHHKFSASGLEKKTILLANISQSSKIAVDEDLTKDLKKIVLGFPSADSLDSHRRQKEYFETLAQNKIQTRELLQMFRDLKTLQTLFGDEQAQARVKLLDFFKHIKKDYAQEIRNSLVEMQKDPDFIHKKMGRDFDYRDLAQIYFSSLSEEEIRNNFISELKKIQYNSKHNWLIAYAIAHAHPNLLQDQEFTTWAQSILAEETI